MEFRPEQNIQLRPEFAQLRPAGDLRDGAVRLGNECLVQLWISPGTESEERKHCVVEGGEVAPNVDKPVSTRRDFQIQLFVGKGTEEFADPIHIRSPTAQR